MINESERDTCLTPTNIGLYLVQAKPDTKQEIVSPVFPNPIYLAETANMINSYSGYDESLKKTIHARLRKLLVAFAKNYLSVDQSIPANKLVRTNMAGIAVSGETTLMVYPITGCQKGLYLQCSPDLMQPGQLGIMYRNIRNESDYTGGPNNWTLPKEFFTKSAWPMFAEKCKRVCIPIE